jgi:multiple sugar transport system permease protein
MQTTSIGKAEAPGTLKRLQDLLDKERVLGYVLVAPAIILLVGLIAYPFVIAIWLSVTDKVIAQSASGNFVGVDNFARILKNSIFQQTVVNTFNYTFVSVFFKLAFGLLMALVLNEAIPFRNLFRGALLLPWVVPTSLSALGWLWMFDPTYSVVNWMLVNLGFSAKGPLWLGDPFWAMFSVQLVNVWRGVPFFGISLLAGLQTIQQELYEAAEVDGANSWQRFRHITWPLLIPVTTVVTLFSVIQTFGDFQIVYVLTRGGPMNTTHLFATLSHQIAILGAKISEGAAISLFMFPILVVVIILQLRYIRND